ITIAMTNVSPCTEHKYCLRPIHENMKKQWNGQAYKELLWRCVAATTIPYFDKAIEELKQFNKQAFEWLAKIPAHSWSRSHFSGRAKSDILLNNLCEYFNGKILDARDAPIITALEYIREYLMRRMVNVIAVINKTDGPLTPSINKLLKVAMDKANKYTVGFNEGKSMRSFKGQMDPMNETGTSISQRSTNVVADTRKRPYTQMVKQSTSSSNTGTHLMGIQLLQLELRLGKISSRSFWPVKSAKILWQFWTSYSLRVSLAQDGSWSKWELSLWLCS
ncbi:hypothetical protein Tco_1325319, partial [Tanacetum coccineum]